MRHRLSQLESLGMIHFKQISIVYALDFQGRRRLGLRVARWLFTGRFQQTERQA
jgi:hypothetical protein